MTDGNEECDGCGKTLKQGDQYFPCDDGPYLCAECCPTFADAELHWQEDENDLDETDSERKRVFMESLAAHLAAGGSKDDKLPLARL